MFALRIVLLLGASSCLAGASWSASTADTSANPIRKIVTLLQDMQKEMESEGKKEQELYDGFMCYCKTTSADLGKANDESQSKISEVSAKLEEDESSKTSIDQELVGHKSDRSAAQNDLAKATAIRGKEAEEFAAAEADAKTNLEALSGAIPALEKGMGGAALMQMPSADRLKKLVASTTTVNSFDRENVLAFLEQRANGDYVPQSGQIVGILKNMEDEMSKSLEESQNDEASASAAFADLKSAKTQEISVASAAVEEKMQQSGQLAVLVAQEKNALEDSEAELAETQKYQASIKITCEEKSKEWAARQASRAEEVSAVSEAISILNDDDALDIFKKAVPSFAQMPGVNRMGFLQSKESKSTRGFHRARTIIENAAATYKSQELALISYSLKAKNAPGVAGMIDGMITLLKKEGDDDRKQKEWCEGELTKSGSDEASTTEEQSNGAAMISELKDQIASVADEISTLSLEIQALDASVATASLDRKSENKQYTEGMALNEAASQLIEKAKQRLFKFYNPVMYKEPPKKELTMEEKIYSNAGHDEWTGLVQIRKHRAVPPPPPATFDAYSKKGEKNTGVVALMEMLHGDLQNDMKKAESDEKTAQSEYESLMATSAETRSEKAKSITDKESSKAELEGKFEQAKEGKALTDEQLAQIKTQIGNLHASCDFIMENFDLRLQARTNEMESLRNAKAVLAGATF